LVLSADGGAIATIAATQVTYVGPNNVMTDAFYQALYQSPVLGRSTPIGRAIWMAKISTFSRGSWVRHNSAKYVVLGDPSLRLQSPREALSLSGALSQEIVSGQLVGLRATADPGTPASAGNWYLLAQESSASVDYLMDLKSPDIAPRILSYELVGTPFFRGQGQFGGGELQTQLRTPAFLNFGSRGRVRLIFEDGVQQLVGVADTLTVSRGTPDTNDNRGPTIDLQFANNARRVTPGMTLMASLQDSSGINVLGTVPANSILIEFDTSGAQTDVTDLFRLDENDFRRGSISIPLPSTVEAGEHKVVMSAGDMMSNVSTAEMTFEVVAEGVMDIGRHTPFPNPFQTDTQFAVEVLAPAGVSSSLVLSVFTVDGRRIRTLRDRLLAGGGRVSIPWDGLDERGGEIANGTYLYTLRVNFEGPRGSSQTVTGRVVHMR
jgi:Peptidase family C25